MLQPPEDLIIPPAHGEQGIFVLVDLAVRPPLLHAAQALLVVQIKKHAEIGLSDLRAVDIDTEHPFRVGHGALVGERGIVIPVAEDNAPLREELSDAVDGVYVVRHAVGHEERRNLRAGARREAGESVAREPAGRARRRLRGLRHGIAERAQVLGKRRQLRGFPRAVQPFDDDKFSVHGSSSRREARFVRRYYSKTLFSRQEK